LKLEITPEEAVERINTVFSHAWMVRTFLKHAPEFEDEAELLAIPRSIFDCIRAVESAYVAGDTKRYLKRVKDKLRRLKEVSEDLDEELPDISNHTNFQQAALSLRTCVREIEGILKAVDEGKIRTDETS